MCQEIILQRKRLLLFLKRGNTERGGRKERVIPLKEKLKVLDQTKEPDSLPTKNFREEGHVIIRFQVKKY